MPARSRCTPINWRSASCNWGDLLIDMIKEDLVTERIAIDRCREMITYLGIDDPTTRRLMQTILAMEEEHADDLVNLLEEFGS